MSEKQTCVFLRLCLPNRDGSFDFCLIQPGFFSGIAQISNGRATAPKFKLKSSMSNVMPLTLLIPLVVPRKHRHYVTCTFSIAVLFHLQRVSWRLLKKLVRKRDREAEGTNGRVSASECLKAVGDEQRSRFCWNQSILSTQGSITCGQLCNNCKRPGHYARDCPKYVWLQQLLPTGTLLLNAVPSPFVGIAGSQVMLLHTPDSYMSTSARLISIH
ncbi:hypothetical protein EJ110_NYTH14301 [Nymphaea thermarum]|nr:hypothetical protein EJ110_NYTH14301 [Nymphaea thermarum]